jgi:PAS domain S-box-containing protein
MPFGEIIGKRYFEVFPKMEVPFKMCLRAIEDMDDKEEVYVPSLEKIFVVGFYPVRDKEGNYLYSAHIMEDMTEEKRAMEALSESEEKFRNITASAKDAIIMIGNEGEVEFWNNAAEKISGCSAGEMMEKELHTLFVPERYRAAYREGFRRFRETGEGPAVGKTLELAALRKDGKEFPVELSLSAISVKGKWHAIGIVRDITERKQAEEALRKSEEKFRDLVESTSDWIWEIDESGIYTYASPKVKDLLGYEPQEVIGKSPFDLMHQEEAKRVAEEFGAIVNAGRPFAGLENTNLHKDGHCIVLETSGVPIFDAEGNFRGYRGIGRDITERKKAAEALRESEERYRRTIDNMLEGGQIIGFDWRYLYVNDTAARQGRRTKAELLGREMMEVYPGIENTDMFAVLRRCMVERIPSHIENEFTYPDGTAGWFELSIQPVPEGVFILSEDIAERKKLDTLLKEYSASLEQEVKLRTQELENANIELQVLNREIEERRKEAEEAKAQADAANQAKSDFLANMSHELRTPLNSVIGFAEVLEDQYYGTLNEKQKEYVKDIHISGKHLLNLINDILDLSKVEAGKMELELGDVSIFELLHSSITMFKEKAMKHSIKLTADIEPDADMTIQADERKMKQIVFNLLSNAMKFTPDGGSVRVSARRVKTSEFGVHGENRG